jgi:proline-specific peptidase
VRTVEALVNGAHLAYDDSGQGQAILLLHGGPGMSDRTEGWRTFAPLGERYRLVAFDLRGCGQSEAIAPYSHAQWVADAEALRVQLGLGPVVLLGGSYGGHLALEYTLAHPEAVRALILRDTAASGRYHAMAKATAVRRIPDIPRDALDRLFEGRIRSDEDFRACYAAIQPLYRVVRDPDQERVALERIPFRYETHNWAFGRNQPAFDLVPRLGEIHVPTLVTVGRHDWICPVEASQEIAEAIAGARLVVFERSGHSPQVEEHDAYLSLVRSFLDDAL